MSVDKICPSPAAEDALQGARVFFRDLPDDDGHSIDSVGPPGSHESTFYNADADSNDELPPSCDELPVTLTSSCSQPIVKLKHTQTVFTVQEHEAWVRTQPTQVQQLLADSIFW